VPCPAENTEICGFAELLQHFYPAYFSKYHWPMHAFALPDAILKKVYHDNAAKLLAFP
jgi:hypothetical protein